LLDNLAVAFYQSDWDVKAIMRLLVMSHAIVNLRSLSTGTAPEARPENQLVARNPEHRLPPK